MYVNVEPPKKREYLGETPVDLTTHPVYASYTPAQWALEWIHQYGQIDGAHHKAWVLDQVARILNGTPVTAKMASWSDGQQELRLDLQDPPTPEYNEWVLMTLGPKDDDGEHLYSYEIGIAP